MKVNEFRIGNYYDHNGNIAFITINNILELYEGERSWIKPIPLVEEWMLRLGFKKHKCGISGADEWQGMDGWSIGDSGWIFRGDPKFELKLVGFINSSIKYVHQLQNIYFDITGDELCIDKFKKLEWN